MARISCDIVLPKSFLTKMVTRQQTLKYYHTTKSPQYYRHPLTSVQDLAIKLNAIGSPRKTKKGYPQKTPTLVLIFSVIMRGNWSCKMKLTKL